MRKVHFIIAFYALDRRIKITKLYLGKFFVYELHKLFYTHSLARFGHADFTEIPIRVYIKITPLYHAEVSFFDQFS